MIDLSRFVTATTSHNKVEEQARHIRRFRNDPHGNPWARRWAYVPAMATTLARHLDSVAECGSGLAKSESPYSSRWHRAA